jgi:hypothetical protein
VKIGRSWLQKVHRFAGAFLLTTSANILAKSVQQLFYQMDNYLVEHELYALALVIIQNRRKFLRPVHFYSQCGLILTNTSQIPLS